MEENKGVRLLLANKTIVNYIKEIVGYER